MKITFRFASLAFATTLAVVGAPESRAQYYTVTDLGVLTGKTSSSAYGINNSGLIVGVSSNSAGGSFAFADSGGVMTNLGTFPGGNFSVATAVNNSGLIVGSSGTATGAIQAFSDEGGVMSNLGGNSSAYAVNNAGVIVGLNGNDAFSDAGGVMTNLGTLPGGSYSIAFGVNDSDLIVGTSVSFSGDNESYSAFSDFGDVMTKLWSGEAKGVNNSGQIVGWYATDSFINSVAYSYLDGVGTDLGTLGGVDGYLVSAAEAVNDSGLIVGYSTTPAALEQLNAFSDIGGVMTDLNSVTSSLGTDITTLEFANAVNDEGFIVGQGITLEGKDVAFLLTPTAVAPTQTLSDYPIYIPDVSSSALLLAMGLAGIEIAGYVQKIRHKQETRMRNPSL